MHGPEEVCVSELAPTQEQVRRGHAAYTPLTLRGYDLWVHGVNNRFAWCCPTARLIDWTQRHLSGTHLDVGVGTGFLLDQAGLPGPAPRLTLLDLNPASLAACAGRLARYTPSTVQASALEPFPLPNQRFGSVGMMYLLHCLPAGLPGGKWAALDNAGRVLAPQGVVFGATLLGERPTTAFGRASMDFFNRRGVFDNLGDTVSVVEEAVRARFSEATLERVGQVMLFAGRGWRGA